MHTRLLGKVLLLSRGRGISWQIKNSIGWGVWGTGFGKEQDIDLLSH